MIPQEKIDRERRVLGLEVQSYQEKLKELLRQIEGYKASIQSCEEGIVILEKDPEAYFRNPEEEEDEND